MKAPAMEREKAGWVVAITAVALLALGAAGVRTAAAGTQTTTNACLSNATATYSDVDIVMAGIASPNPVTLGGTVTLSAASLQASVPATLLIAGYNLGLLTVGANNVPVLWWASRSATNTVEGQDVQNGSVGVTTTITDPDGVPGTGDESATDLSLNVPLADWTVTPTGGDVAFSQGGVLPTIPAGVVGVGSVTPSGSAFINVQIGGLINANFDCQPGVTNVAGPDGIPGNSDDSTTFTPSSPSPFETATVNPPTPAADLSVTMSAPSSVSRNSTLIYAIEVSNAGPDPADNVALTDELPYGTVFLAVTATGWDCTAPAPGTRGGTVTCVIDPLAAAGSVATSIGVKIRATAGQGAIINAASVTSDTPDPVTSNNTASVATNVTKK